MIMMTTGTLKINNKPNIHDSNLDILICHKGHDYQNNNNHNTNNYDSSTIPYSFEATKSMKNLLIYQDIQV